MADRQKSVERFSFPQEPIDRLVKPINQFLHVEAASGIVLLLCAVAALAAANSAIAEAYLGFWKTPIGVAVGDFELRHSLKHWINDGLMAVFFFVIGLEVKRELVLGELQDIRRAALPLAAALGGMLLPASIYLASQFGETGQRGWGIPMATDIAFVVGCMAVLGRRVPSALRIVLLSLAIIDDIGAILVIAFGYTESIHWIWLTAGIAGIGLVCIMQRLGIRSMGMYTLLGVLIWLGFHESGIHATIAGVVLGLMTPARAYLERGTGKELLKRASEFIHGGSWEKEPDRAAEISRYRRATRETISPLEYLIHVLHPWVAFFIMPVFALANAGVPFQAADAASPVALAVIAGLAVGKPAGILILCWLALKTGLARLPAGVTWRHLAGGGFLAGIGFTMALFIAGLAFADETLLRSAKVGVLVGSLTSAVVGMAVLATSPVSLAATQTGPVHGSEP
ncbi:Na+/H+ antiporter NhaA [Alienimonas californiensis]|uniref:Na(+)/H(+) antiporter NhaA n=1 Tax=Alienimonas californiensis TaxID=2527989 RepID=A0A517PDH0_9PLAN|nr:Na(+)/H(+) antiporter NhaA [Alienimonas californiensis]